MASKEQVNGWVFAATGGNWFSSLKEYHFNKLLLSDFYCSTILLLLWSLAVGCDLVASRLGPEVVFFLPKNWWLFLLYALPGYLFRFRNRLGLTPITTLCVWNFGKMRTLNFRGHVNEVSYFGELYSTANEPWPQHPKRERMAKMDHKLSSTPNDPRSCLLGAGNFFQPHSSRLTPQRGLNEEIKYGDEMTNIKVHFTNEGVTDALAWISSDYFESLLLPQ